MACVTPVMEHWLEWEIAQWVHHEGLVWQPIAPRANALTTDIFQNGCFNQNSFIHFNDLQHKTHNLPHHVLFSKIEIITRISNLAYINIKQLIKMPNNTMVML